MTAVGEEATTTARREAIEADLAALRRTARRLLDGLPDAARTGGDEFDVQEAVLTEVEARIYRLELALSGLEEEAATGRHP